MSAAPRIIRAHCVYAVALRHFLFAPILVAQHAVMSPPPKEPRGTPVSAPEPRRKLSRPPRDLFAAITSQDPAQRAFAMDVLFAGHGNKTPAIPDFTLRAVQLDDDDDPEYIFTFHFQPQDAPPNSAVLIADRSPDGWYVVAEFDYSWHWDRETAEKVIEIHPPYVLIRDVGGGSGFSETHARIYRLWHGRLYSTLDIEEQASSGGAGLSRLLETRITFRWDQFPWGGLEVRKDETSADASNNWKTIRKRSCTGYEWRPATFSFVAIRRATRALCQSPGQ